MSYQMRGDIPTGKTPLHILHLLLQLETKRVTPGQPRCLVPAALALALPMCPPSATSPSPHRRGHHGQLRRGVAPLALSKLALHVLA